MNIPESIEGADARFHRTLFGSLEPFDETRPPCLTYVENGNAIAGYDQLALDYKMAADLMISQAESSGLSNWTAPLAFIVRQTLELSLKALLEASGSCGNTVSDKILFSHRLDFLWKSSHEWLTANGYKINEDARIEHAIWMIENFHVVDPTGDLFRFAYSKSVANGRNKTYDKAGIYHDLLVLYFESTYGLLNHWSGVLVVEWIKATHDMDVDYSHFDPEGFPRKG